MPIILLTSCCPQQPAGVTFNLRRSRTSALLSRWVEPEPRPLRHHHQGQRSTWLSSPTLRAPSAHLREHTHTHTHVNILKISCESQEPEVCYVCALQRLQRYTLLKLDTFLLIPYKAESMFLRIPYEGESMFLRTV